MQDDISQRVITTNTMQKFECTSHDFEDIVNGYKSRKPNDYPDLKLVTEKFKSKFAHLLKGVEGTAQALSVNLQEGLSSPQDIKEREITFGSNKGKQIITRSIKKCEKILGICSIMKDAASDKTMIVLLIASAVLIILNEIMEDDKTIAWTDGFGIFLAVAVVVLVQTVNEYQKEKQFMKLNQSAESEKIVMYNNIFTIGALQEKGDNRQFKSRRISCR